MPHGTKRDPPAQHLRGHHSAHHDAAAAAGNRCLACASIRGLCGSLAGNWPTTADEQGQRKQLISRACRVDGLSRLLSLQAGATGGLYPDRLLFLSRPHPLQIRSGQNLLSCHQRCKCYQLEACAMGAHGTEPMAPQIAAEEMGQFLHQQPHPFLSVTCTLHLQDLHTLQGHVMHATCWGPAASAVKQPAPAVHRQRGCGPSKGQAQATMPLTPRRGCGSQNFCISNIVLPAAGGLA